MNPSDTDKILHMQLAVARMGEKELMNWWNTDIAYEMGGADFLKRLLGDTLAPLASAEGLLKAAALKESQLIQDMPDQENARTLFLPEPEAAIAAEDRIRYFKRYPDSLPENIARLLDPKTEWTAEALAALIPSGKSPEYAGSSFGREIERPPGAGIIDIMANLAAMAAGNDKSRYILAYYRDTAHE